MNKTPTLPLLRSQYQIFPPLPPDRRAALDESILAHGVESPTTWDDQGNLLDGCERENICAAHEIRCPREVRCFESEAEKFKFILAVNAHRRPALSGKQKRVVIEAYLLGDPEIADHNLSQTLGVSKNTVLAVRSRLEAACTIKKVEKTKGKDGKVRPVHYSKRIITYTPRDFEQAQQIVKDLPDKCAGKTVDIASARKLAARNRNKVEREGRIIEPLPDDAIRIYHCRFQDLAQRAAVAPSSVNLVLTDIPYGKEFLPQLEDLAEFAQQVLVEGGLFVCLCGQFWLHKVIEAMNRSLTYRWVNASVWNGSATPVHIGGWKEPHGRVLSKWKPILVYSNGGFPNRGQWCDVFNVNAKEKNWHVWQQPLEEVEMLVRYFSDPGDLVVDPCGGGFTTAEACLRLNRRCVSCDDVAENYQQGLCRLEKATADKNANELAGIK